MCIVWCHSLDYKNENTKASCLPIPFECDYIVCTNFNKLLQISDLYVWKLDICAVVCLLAAVNGGSGHG